MIVVYSAAATEPITAAQARTFAQVDTIAQEPAPGAITVALAGGGAGNVNNGAHRYRATFVTADGATQGGTVSSAVTTTSGDGQVALTAIPLGGALVTSRTLYRTAAGGSTFLLLATISNNTATTYTDNIADGSLGAEAPATNTTDDPLLGILIASARAAAEQELRRYLVTQTLDAYIDKFPSYDDNEDYAIRLPPLQSVTSITYVDTDGATQTLAASKYTVDAKSQPARITPAYSESWPSTRDQVNAVTVRFVGGYGAAAAVPQCVKNWMLIRIRTSWESRSSLVVGTSGLVVMPASFIDSLLDSERVVGRVI